MSWLCFVGGFMTFVFGAIGMVNIFGALFAPLYYLVNAFQMLFGLATCIIEAPGEWVHKSPQLKKAQGFIYEFSKFLTTFGGRGLFYLFQGSLAISLTGMSLQFLLGCYMFFVGALCIATQFGVGPEPMSGGPPEGHHSAAASRGAYIKIEA